mgnify:CR=1 FL=1
MSWHDAVQGFASLAFGQHSVLQCIFGEFAHTQDVYFGGDLEAGIARTDVLEMTVVGNPIMHHLLLGHDPVELGGAPPHLAADAGSGSALRVVAAATLRRAARRGR